MRNKKYSFILPIIGIFVLFIFTGCNHTNSQPDTLDQSTTTTQKQTLKTISQGQDSTEASDEGQFVAQVPKEKSETLPKTLIEEFETETESSNTEEQENSEEKSSKKNEKVNDQDATTSTPPEVSEDGEGKKMDTDTSEQVEKEEETEEPQEQTPVVAPGE